MAKIIGWHPLEVGALCLGNAKSATDYLVWKSQLLPYKFRGILLIQVSVFAISLDLCNSQCKKV